MMPIVRLRIGVASVVAIASLASACGDLNGTPQLPLGTVDAGAVRNAEGAAGMAITARLNFQKAHAIFVLTTGLFTDELQANERGRPSNPLSDLDPTIAADVRRDGESQYASDVYVGLQSVRTLSAQAIGALAKYDPDHSANRRGALYAMEGIAEMELADLFCSGVPLSHYDFDGDFAYGPSLTTEELYRHALAMFDTALALGHDSVAVVTMAKVGSARALIALGDYATASDTIASITTDARVSELLSTCAYRVPCSPPPTAATFAIAAVATVADREGTVGLPFVSQYDPRTATTILGSSQYGFTDYFADKFNLNAVSQLDIATGVEARLIQAEADLRAGGTQWLTILNDLRTDGTYTVSTRTGAPGQDPGPAGYPDTTWGPGSGAYLIPASVIADVAPQCDPSVVCTDTTWYHGLAPLHDPGTAKLRATLLLTERARWLFASGHRQGDLRRLLRDTDPAWRRRLAEVYPTGVYPVIGAYSANADMLIPQDETINPLFHGCLSRD